MLLPCLGICAAVTASTIAYADVRVDVGHRSNDAASALESNGIALQEMLNKAERLGILTGALQFNPLLRGANIAVALEGIEGDVAVLTGQVDDLLTKDLAEQIALSVKGVEQVRNGLSLANKSLQEPEAFQGQGELKPHQRLSNVTITNKVRSQLLANRQTSGTDIDVVTHNRVVTITGEVQNQAEKELAYWLVRNTRGVTDVIDQLDVNLPIERQASIQGTEQSQLQMEVDVEVEEQQ